MSNLGFSTYFSPENVGESSATESFRDIALNKSANLSPPLVCSRELSRMQASNSGNKHIHRIFFHANLLYPLIVCSRELSRVVCSRELSCLTLERTLTHTNPRARNWRNQSSSMAVMSTAEWKTWPEICVDDAHRTALLSQLATAWPLGDGLASLWVIVVDYAVNTSQCQTLVLPDMDEDSDCRDIIKWNTNNVTGILGVDSQFILNWKVFFNPDLSVSITGKSLERADDESKLWAGRFSLEPRPLFDEVEPLYWRNSHLQYPWGNYQLITVPVSSLECLDWISDQLYANSKVVRAFPSSKLLIQTNIQSRQALFRPHAIRTILAELKLANACLTQLVNSFFLYE